MHLHGTAQSPGGGHHVEFDRGSCSNSCLSVRVDLVSMLRVNTTPPAGLKGRAFFFSVISLLSLDLPPLRYRSPYLLF